MDYLDKLNPEQRKAVTAGGGPVLVLAGPGSGKTRVLTQRVAYLIEQERIRPYRILAVTFTNKAAREMQTRVEKLLGSDATQGMMLGTFHSICARLLRREAETLSIGSNFVIFDADDQERMVKGIIRELNLSEKLYRPASVHAAISSAKNELIKAGDYPTTNYRDEVVKRVYTEYQKRLIASNAVDFDDLLMYTAHLLEDNPAVREKYARRFEHVLVDEFQDTNLAQYTLLKHLASAHHNIFVVGDPDQCFPTGTLIRTPGSEKRIETFQPGDIVLAAGGNGSAVSGKVSRVGKRHYRGELLQVVTRGGSSFRATPNHLIFGRLPGSDTRDTACIRINQMQSIDIGGAAENFIDNPHESRLASSLFLVESQKSALTFPYNLLPASQLRPSTIVAVEQNGEIIEAEIESIIAEEYDGYVHDLEVDELHNYLAGGIVVHNSIYRWRGADWRNVQRFEQDFPDAQVILLEQNYRSRQTILDAAMGVINRAPNRRRKQLFTDRGGGEKIYYYEAPDDYSEASFVVDSIAQLVASREFEPGECAVMYRTNAQSRLLEEAFLQARLPYRLVGAQRFYGRREIKDLIAFLRLVHNPADEASLDRVINIPPRGIGDKTLVTLRTAAHQNNTSAGLILLDLARGADSSYWNQFAARSVIALAQFGAALADWNAAAPSLGVPELFDRLVKDLNYKAYVDDESEEGADRWENVQELRRLALEYSTRTLDEFLENVALVADQDTIQDNVNAPTLLTLHAAKGLEFGAVFIVGLDDGILPHSRSFDEPEQMEEERRLFYVGITRAKDRLYLMRAIQRGGRGYAEETYPSRFLEDVPEGLLVGKSRTGRGLRDRAAESQWAASRRTAPAAPVMDPKFRAGIRVKHPMWGEGIVLNSRVQADDEILEVVFESVGVKRLSASLANLMII
jgi:superfamily I DNA/RNA helicase